MHNVTIEQLNSVEEKDHAYVDSGTSRPVLVVWVYIIFVIRERVRVENSVSFVHSESQHDVNEEAPLEPFDDSFSNVSVENRRLGIKFDEKPLINPIRAEEIKSRNRVQ